MSARNIEYATKRLQRFSIRSKIYSFFFLATSAIMLTISTFVDGGQTLSSILAGGCLLLIPCALYFTSVVLGKVTQKILKRDVSSSGEFDKSFRGPFNGISWVIFLLTFSLAGAEVLLDYFIDRSFGVYSILLVTFTMFWLARFYMLFHDLKESISFFKEEVDQVEAANLPDGERALVEEAQRGNTETLVDKRDVLTSL